MAEYLTVAEAAKVLGCGVVTIRRYIHAGKLKAFQRSGAGNVLLVEKNEVDALGVPRAFAPGAAGFPPVPFPKKSKRRK